MCAHPLIKTILLIQVTMCAVEKDVTNMQQQLQVLLMKQGEG